MSDTLTDKVHYGTNVVFDVPMTYEEQFTIYRLMCNGQVLKDYCDTRTEAVSRYVHRLEDMLGASPASKLLAFNQVLHTCWVLLVIRDPYTGEIEHAMDSGQHTCGAH